LHCCERLEDKVSLDLLKDEPLPRGDEVIDADDEGIRREL
jgi:hypothetical protein